MQRHLITSVLISAALSTGQARQHPAQFGSSYECSATEHTDHQTCKGMLYPEQP